MLSPKWKWITWTFAIVLGAVWVAYLATQIAIGSTEAEGAWRALLVVASGGVVTMLIGHWLVRMLAREILTMLGEAERAQAARIAEGTTVEMGPRPVTYGRARVHVVERSDPVPKILEADEIVPADIDAYARGYADGLARDQMRPI